jgi:hypothetical protein
MKSKASFSIIRLSILTVIRKENTMATYYIGADVHKRMYAHRLLDWYQLLIPSMVWIFKASADIVLDSDR